MKVKSVLASLLIASFAFAQSPPAPPTPPGPPKAEIKHLPKTADPSRETAIVGELLQLKGSSDSRWGFDPQTAANSFLLPDGNGNASFSAAAVGTYYVVCFNASGEAWFRVDVGGNVNPSPGPSPTPPGPNPPGPPTPGPTPTPAPAPVSAAVKYFFVIEDTSKSGQFRGQVLTDPTLKAWVTANISGYRILRAGVDYGSAPMVGDAIKSAAGKTVPWIALFGSDQKLITAVACPTDAAGLLGLLQQGGTKGEQHVRKMGNIPPPNNRLKLAAKLYGSTPDTPIIPRAQWKLVNLEQYLPPVYDQDGIGQCNCSATCTATEACRAQEGLPYVHLSAGDLYSQINGGRDEGSLLEDGLSAMMNSGVATAKTVPYVWDKRVHNDATTKSERQLYQVTEAYLCPNFDAVGSAIQNGFFVVVGIAWYDNYNPDSDGWLPGPRGNWGGHALCSYGIAQRNGQYGVWTRNSWGTTWGKEGNFVIPESAFGSSIGGFWAVRSVKQNPQDFVFPASGKLSMVPKFASQFEREHFLAP